ncbi:MAG: hypothetical protein V3W04_05845 [Gammaproteobacteria bacterium]
MPRKYSHIREVIAQEAAKIVVESGVRDYLLAKRKAASMLGFQDSKLLPANTEIEKAVVAHLNLFQADTYLEALSVQRNSAVEAMKFFKLFSPRLVGQVLAGTASRHSVITLHLFADTPEDVIFRLMGENIPFESDSMRFRFSRDEFREYPAFHFTAGEEQIELVVFPVAGLREAPMSPVDGNPMQRASLADVQALLVGG